MALQLRCCYRLDIQIRQMDGRGHYLETRHYVYAEGVPPNMMPLRDVFAFRIERIRFTGMGVRITCLNRHFLRFQRKIRQWLAIKKMLFGFWRRRELSFSKIPLPAPLGKPAPLHHPQ